MGAPVSLLNSPSIAGVALQIRWSDVEPEQGAPDWSQLDELFAAATSAKKVMGADGDPALALNRSIQRALRAGESGGGFEPHAVRRRPQNGGVILVYFPFFTVVGELVVDISPDAAPWSETLPQLEE